MFKNGLIGLVGKMVVVVSSVELDACVLFVSAPTVTCDHFVVGAPLLFIQNIAWKIIEVFQNFSPVGVLDVSVDV
mgnify:CR=1 FL=1